MRFDDRLITVLRHSPAHSRDRVVQWRQIVELLARGACQGNPAVRAEALQRLEQLAPDVPVEVRSAAVRAIAGAPVAPDLMMLVVADRPEVAAPLLHAIPADEDVWTRLRAAASAEVGDMMDALRPARAKPAEVAPPPQDLIARAPASPPPVASDPVVDRLSAAAPAYIDSRPAQRQGTGRLFRWECGPTGEIDWVEGAPRAALIGRSIADDLDRRFAARLPFEDEALVLADDGLLAGAWRWSGSPAFFPDTGRFAGYRGVARREGASVEAAPVGHALPPLDADQLRELVHELRTPLNAIIGFGEIIDGQYLGPAHRAYRERASEIVGHARRLLGAVEDLDLAAKLQAGRQDSAEGASVDEVFPALRSALLEQATGQGVALGITVRRHGQRCAVPPDLLMRLSRRFLDAVLGVAQPGERLDLTMDRAGQHLAIAVDRPRATLGVGEDQLLDPAFDPTEDAALGIGFALRLVRGLTGIAGGRLDVSTDRLTLLLPAADG
ncbi:histidine kinase dimerization/phospho-acceptor domain-containing protein [Sphingomonas sp. GCM10030256]|uniref:histidine kinase dimerization/phospho-acceptor domain-containing protein n=1 Tax=Sphingomonas sp. GCM10030256 TaxID=3273427 RepID=UPI00360CA6D1